MNMTATNPSTMSERRNRQSSAGNRQTLCWQGWRLEVPARWNPVKLEGTFEQGYVLLADLVRPRLAIRWSTSKKAAKNSEIWAGNALVAEVGRLAADEAKPFAMPAGRWQASQLYIEPDAPGRDVWVGYSETSGRAVEVVHHAHRRERVLADVVLPTLVDEGDQPERRWSALDLSCVTPGWLRLDKPLLFAGDLGLRFAGPKRQQLVIRQVAPAEIALRRMPLANWLRKQQLDEKKNYRPMKPLPPPSKDATAEDAAAALDAAAAKLGYERVSLTTADGRELIGYRAPLPRRRRFWFKFMLPKELATYALHDKGRDRLIIVHGGGAGVDLEAMATKVGWAATTERS